MAAGNTLPSGWVTQFRGENRVAPDIALPPNISPDATNIDYLDGVLKKRAGLKRRHKQPMNIGGALVMDARAGNRYLRVDQSANSEFQYTGARPLIFEFAFTFDSKPDTSSLVTGEQMPLIDNGGTTGAGGFDLSVRWNGSAWRLRATIIRTGPASVTLDHTTDLDPHTTYYVRVGLFDQGLTSSDFFIEVNGVQVSTTLASSYLNNSGTYLIFGTNAPIYAIQQVKVVLDDIRVWNSDRARADTYELYDTTSGVGWHRPMTDEEAADAESASTLAAYWRLDEKDSSGDFVNDGGVVSDVLEVVGTVPLAKGLVLDGNFDEITGMAAVFTGDTETGLIVCTFTTIYLLTYSTDSVESIHFLDSPSRTRWQFARHSDYLLMSNGEEENLRYDSTNGLQQLSFDAPASAPSSAVAGGSGTFSGAGDVKYIIAFYNENTGQESYVATDVETATLTAGTDEVTLTNFPQTGQFLVTHYRLYRTEVNGSTFYLFKTLPYPTTSYVDDDTQDGGGAGDGALDTNTPWYKYKGYAAPSLVLMEHKGNVLAMNQSGNESRILFSEPGTEGDFYFNNFFHAGLGDGDEITGAVNISGVPIIFKRRSIWVVLGSGPSTYSARRLYGGVGCVHGATLSESQQGVFFQGYDGVYLLPLPLQSAPPMDITENTQRPLFTDMRDDARRRAFGIFDDSDQRYYLRLDVGDTKVVLVFDLRDSSWAKWEMEADALALAKPDGGVPETLVGFKGYASILDSEKYNDGMSCEGVTEVVAKMTTTNNLNTATPFYQWVSADIPVLDLDSFGVYQGLKIRLDYPDEDEFGQPPDRAFEEAVILHSRVQGSNYGFRLTTAIQGAGPTYEIPEGTVITIERISCAWRTGRHTYDGALDDQKAWERFRAVFEDGGTAELDAYFTARRDEAATPQDYTQEFTLDASKRIARQGMEIRGDEIIFGFTEVSADATWKLSAFQTSFQQRDPRPE